MSYHGNPPRGYNKTGIEVVNPLQRIERKLNQIKNIVLDEDRNEDLSKDELLALLEEVLNE